MNQSQIISLVIGCLLLYYFASIAYYLRWCCQYLYWFYKYSNASNIESLIPIGILFLLICPVVSPLFPFLQLILKCTLNYLSQLSENEIITLDGRIITNNKNRKLIRLHYHLRKVFKPYDIEDITEQTIPERTIVREYTYTESRAVAEEDGVNLPVTVVAAIV